MSGVSVIIPNYNHAKFLAQRIDSVLNQDMRPVEIIVLDDASTDKSLEVIKRYAGSIAQIIVSETNSGSPFKQWKKGIEAASGEWIWIAESDDYCEPNFLSTLMHGISDAVGVVYSQTFDVREGEIIVDRVDTTEMFQPNIWRSDFEMDGKSFCMDYLSVKNVVPNASAVVFRKSLAIDAFDDTLLEMRMCGDWLFWIRLISKTRISFKAQHLNFFRFLKQSTRSHSGFERIAGRISEEAVVRESLSLMGVVQDAQVEALRKKWYDIHRIGQMFAKEFQQINRSGLFPSFTKEFILYKLNKKRGNKS